MDNDDRINEIKGKAADAAKKAQEAASKAANKADELYNKLPLDQINEKLGGKIDVKSKKFKIIAGIVVVLLLVITGSCLFGSAASATIPLDNAERAKKALALSDHDYAEFLAICAIKAPPRIQKNETFKAFIKRYKASFNENDQKAFQKKYDEIISNIKAERKAMKDNVAQLELQAHHVDVIKSKAPGIVNKTLDETYDTCIKVDELSLSYRNGTKDEFWNGVATLKNSKTGKIKRRRVEVMYGANDMIVVTLTNNRVD